MNISLETPNTIATRYPRRKTRSERGGESAAMGSACAVQRRRERVPRGSLRSTKCGHDIRFSLTL
eukprot:3052511-Rhodomonas_salina.1